MLIAKWSILFDFELEIRNYIMDNLDSSSKWHRSRNMVLQALSRSLLQCSVPPIVHYLITIIQNIQMISYVLSVGSQFQWK